MKELSVRCGVARRLGLRRDSLLMLIDVPHTLQHARTRFARFYGLATVRDATVMDAAVLAQAALNLGSRTSREGLDDTARRQLDGATDRIERRLMEVLAALRATATFGLLDCAAQSEIDEALRSIGPGAPAGAP